MSDIVQKLWGFCHTLRHDGIDYGDYIEQLTYLLFLKMAEERGVERSRRAATGQRSRTKSGTALTDHYADILRKLRESRGHARRHLRAGHAALQQPGQPQAAHRHDRRGGVVRAWTWT